jgi:quinolinate synthase
MVSSTRYSASVLPKLFSLNGKFSGLVASCKRFPLDEINPFRSLYLHRRPFGSAHRRYHSTATLSAAHGDLHSSGSFLNPKFPSLILGANGSITASGSFAEAQKVFLQPDEASVARLIELLQSTGTGIVAHYYMDVELQGVLQAVGQQLPGRIGVADSLKMGDMAVDMVSSDLTGNASACKQIICLGVDFMSESVAAILQRNGFSHIPVYRAAQAKIGCSLAESAESETYRAWIQAESNHTEQPLLHVVYINTSLETKAASNSVVPTITCTSSNVLQTILTAAVQIPNVKILYGPDTYMGENLITFLSVIENSWTDDQIRTKLHPQHNKQSLRRLRESLVVYPSGNCIVHHMFGSSVVQTVKQFYNEAYVTAHLEVPGEMFDIAMHKSLSDDGVCGSTSDILKFIARKVREAATTTSTATINTTKGRRLQFILGTEAGMVTSIVSSVQAILRETGNTDVTAEIIFPVASEAVMATDDEASPGLKVVPGVAGGEGCSAAGGCATCPYMKMNSLDSLSDLVELIRSVQSHPSSDDQSVQSPSQKQLQRHLPPNRLLGKWIDGRLASDLGAEPIVYMREFNRTKQIPTDLVQRVMKNATNELS